jgi:hypothetical protein
MSVTRTRQGAGTSSARGLRSNSRQKAWNELRLPAGGSINIIYIFILGAGTSQLQVSPRINIYILYLYFGAVQRCISICSKGSKEVEGNM